MPHCGALRHIFSILIAEIQIFLYFLNHKSQAVLASLFQSHNYVP